MYVSYLQSLKKRTIQFVGNNMGAFKPNGRLVLFPSCLFVIAIWQTTYSVESLTNPDFAIGQWIDSNTRYLISISAQSIVHGEQIVSKTSNEEIGKEFVTIILGSESCQTCRYFKSYHPNIMSMGEGSCLNKKEGDPCSGHESWTEKMLYKVTPLTLENCPDFFPNSSISQPLTYDEDSQGYQSEFIDNCGDSQSELLGCPQNEDNFRDQIHFNIHLGQCPFAPQFHERAWFLQSGQCVGTFQMGKDTSSEYFVAKMAESEVWNDGRSYYNEDIYRCFRIKRTYADYKMFQGFEYGCEARNGRELTTSNAQRRIHVKKRPRRSPSNLIPDWLDKKHWILKVLHHDQGLDKFRLGQFLAMEGNQMEVVGNGQKIVEYTRFHTEFATSREFKGVLRSNDNCIIYYHCLLAKSLHSQGDERAVEIQIGLGAPSWKEACSGKHSQIPIQALLVKAVLVSKHDLLSRLDQLRSREDSNPRGLNLQTEQEPEQRQEKALDSRYARLWREIVAHNDQFMRNINQTFEREL